MHKHTRTLLFALGALCAACSNNSTSIPSGQSFVTSQVGATSETSDPVQINDLNLSFSEDPNAFNGLFQ